ncbi:hypothetical protein CEXT_245601 [Caerostris extrusa]|uniref:Transmembrane protein n=1 Tax=Caerostris extrusa TaxID=172846 RepID=A0AAV4Q6X9_CAEEX|nr:hypothetical protein CEXT_245601 [Caerostris extrusa]
MKKELEVHYATASLVMKWGSFSEGSLPSLYLSLSDFFFIVIISSKSCFSLRSFLLPSFVRWKRTIERGVEGWERRDEGVDKCIRKKNERKKSSEICRLNTRLTPSTTVIGQE